MRWFVVLPFVVLPFVALLGACGRFGFASIEDTERDGGTDARSSDAAPGSYAATVLADGPRAYYRLGETGSPTSFGDTMGSTDAEIAANGGLIELGLPGLAGDSGTAIRFAADGNLGGPRVDAWGQINPLWPAFAGDFTIELFIRPITRAPPSISHSFFICEDYLTNGFRTGIDATGHVQIWAIEGAGLGDLVSTTETPLGESHHFAFVKRGTSVEIFDNAVVVASDPVFELVTPTSTAEIGFGAFHGMPADAVLDELAIYDVALTQAQLAAHVAASR